MSYVDSVLQELTRKNSGQDEFLQAATEVLNSLRPVIDANPQFQQASLLERFWNRNACSCSACRG